MKIFVIEDQPTLSEQILNALIKNDFTVEEAASYQKAREKLCVYTYDLVIIDINLPGGSGLDLVQLLKDKNPVTPIIIISARDKVEDRVSGLQLGADDYITKPFDMAELLARVQSVIRRSHFKGNSVVTHANITIDTESKQVAVDDHILDMTKTEYQLLLFFMANKNRVITKEALAEHIWGDHMDIADSFDFIYSHIKNLRKKIKAADSLLDIKSVYGVGYTLYSIK